MKIAIKWVDQRRYRRSSHHHAAYNPFRIGRSALCGVLGGLRRAHTGSARPEGPAGWVRPGKLRRDWQTLARHQALGEAHGESVRRSRGFLRCAGRKPSLPSPCGRGWGGVRAGTDGGSVGSPFHSPRSAPPAGEQLAMTAGRGDSGSQCLWQWHFRACTNRQSGCANTRSPHPPAGVDRSRHR